MVEHFGFMKQTSRKSPTAQTIKQLTTFYHGKFCVLTGKGDGGGIAIEWGHLEDGTSHQVPRFEDVVPIQHGYNKTQEDWRKSSIADEVSRDEELCSLWVGHRARMTFHSGFPGRAYGAARYGLSLAMQYPRKFRAEEGDEWAFLDDCLAYLPYQMEVTLLTSLLETLDKLLEIHRYIPSTHKASILFALGNLYQDAGNWKSSLEVYDKVAKINQGFIETVASVARRQSLAIFSTGGGLDKVHEGLDEAMQLHTDKDFRLSVLIAKAWVLKTSGNFKEGLDILAPFDVPRYRDVTKAAKYLRPHNVHELNMIRGSLKKCLGQSFNGEIDQIKNLQKHRPGTQLRPVFTKHLAQHIIEPEFAVYYNQLSAEFRPSPVLMSLLDRVTARVLIKPESSIHVRRFWAE